MTTKYLQCKDCHGTGVAEGADESEWHINESDVCWTCGGTGHAEWDDDDDFDPVVKMD